MSKQNNLWNRHQNKRARDKKERAKAHSQDFSQQQTKSAGFVSSISGSNCTVILGDESINTTIPLKNLGNLSIGDYVSLKEVSEGLEVDAIIPRKSFISRLRGDSTKSSAALRQHVIAANIDIGIIVVSVEQPTFHQRFVDRCLIVCEAGNVKPAVCLNKTDLSVKLPEILEHYRSLGIPVVETSTITKAGIEELKSLIQGKKVVFFGQSGVGKSSLLNAISPGLELETSAVSQKSEQGRHTTTTSNAFEWSEDSFIIDTPGIRSIGLEDMSPHELSSYFPEFDGFQCKFADCTHTHEPGCGVKEAVSQGRINRDRYESYLRLVD